MTLKRTQMQIFNFNFYFLQKKSGLSYLLGEMPLGDYTYF